MCSMVPGQRPGLFGYGSLEAFYAVGPRTVYLSLADLREGILAHELTHHLLCTVMGTPPPEADPGGLRPLRGIPPVN